MIDLILPAGDARDPGLAAAATDRLDILYFAWVREKMGTAEETVEKPELVTSVGELIAWLAARDERGALAFAEAHRIRAAVGGQMVDQDAKLGQATEIALFPPVTGG